MIPLQEKMIKLAIPNKGRLKDPTINLLKKAGYNFRVKDRLLYSTCTNADLQIIFLRTDDIPILVDSGVIDMGITGSDLLVERNVTRVDEVLPLNFGRCRLCVAVKEDFQGKDIKDLDGKIIATSFPVITKKYFDEAGVSITCIEMGGALEIMVGLRLADAIVDIVETGDTLRDNKLVVFKEINSYQTVMIANKKVSASPEVQKIIRRLQGILIAEEYSLLEYNIKREALKQAEAITPGFEAPTISELDEPDWVSVKVMVRKKEVANDMDRLEAIGATAILETEIINCRL
ncbi:MAG: ATP phosphoribosyltransferase [Spirochaetales bacterium]|nr:ATP phosphoribosyltransferase [Spirochaetales bacterium]